MINSSTVFTGRLGFTTSTLGAKEIRDTGVKSLSRSKGNFLYKLGFTAKAAVTAKSVYPSAGAFAAKSVARTVPPPGLLSMMTV